MNKEFIKKVMREQNLEDWHVILNMNSGLCMLGKKRIYSKKGDKAMFLHEVAHAITPITKDLTGHDSIWADNYTELVRKYLIN